MLSLDLTYMPRDTHIYRLHRDGHRGTAHRSSVQPIYKYNKFQNKIYYRHTGHPGGIKTTTPERLSSQKPGEALKLAVKRMLPGGVLSKKQLTKLKIYAGSDHPHNVQKPQIIDLSKLNSKNIIRK